VVITLPTDAAGHVTHSIAYTAALDNGVTKGETLGAITYTLGGKTIATVPAIALADAPPASMMTKLGHRISSLF
jgi:D-alanyl-D-alanine carboxypeptidase (penicillin-binding protein 5/6)